ncbi:MAG: hypothetical protein HXX80_02220 [Nitrososphaerales archaeon]|nr:hypothetical protein [Nitrososphaerales archaeon]
MVDLFSLIVVLVVLIVLWIAVSIPVYIAAKMVTGGKASLGQAMIATLLGPIVFAIVQTIVILFLGFLGVGPAALLALVLAFIAWLWVYKSSFKTGWLQALGIALLAVVVFFVLSLIILALVPIVSIILTFF